jgi:Protein of unknown function (DUF3443)
VVTARGWILGLGVLVACGPSTSQSDGGTDASTDGDATADAGILNVAPVVVDQGPTGVMAVNVLYVTITICLPGTTTCQTIDHIEVDTGSVGLRIVSSVLSPSLMLPAQTAGNGSPLIECYQYADGFNWGPVLTADVQIGGEMASSVPIQIAGGASSTPVPSDCSNAGSEEDTVAAFGGNGLVGVGYQTADCGSSCVGSSPRTGAYYTCSGSTCTAASAPLSNQVQNPVALFPADNNGVAIQLPSIDPSGAATVMGSLIFGIGTESNNGLGSAQVITTDKNNGYFTTVYNSQTLNSSFIDSGSLSYAFPDTSIPQGSGALTGFFCPTSPLSLMATNEGLNSVNIPTPFSVGNACTLYGNGDAGLDDLAITAFTPGYFDWGLPFFYGRTVFSAISGAMTPAGVGPFFAY